MSFPRTLNVVLNDALMESLVELQCCKESKSYQARTEFGLNTSRLNASLGFAGSKYCCCCIIFSFVSADSSVDRQAHEIIFASSEPLDRE